MGLHFWSTHEPARRDLVPAALSDGALLRVPGTTTPHLGCPARSESSPKRACLQTMWSSEDRRYRDCRRSRDALAHRPRYQSGGGHTLGGNLNRDARNAAVAAWFPSPPATILFTMSAQRKVPVGVLGATGTVGQR